MPENKILIIRGGAIGDFILTLPVLAALKRQFPETRLELLGYPHIAQLALAGGLVEAVHPIEARALAGFFARGGTLAPDLAAYFAGFALILSYLYDPDGIFAENIARVARAQFIAGPHRPNDRLAIHATEALLKPLERLGIFNPDCVPRLNVGRASRASVPSQSVGPASHDPRECRDLLKTAQREDVRVRIALHPGSGSTRKNWAESKWAELLRQLIARSEFHLLLVGGEAEADRLARLAAPLPSRRVALAQSLPLPELALRLQGCAVFLGHDSGITHLAAALGLPTLVLWGETAETVWRPQGQHVRLLRGGPGLRQLEVAHVVRELSELSAQEVVVLEEK